MTRLTPLAKLRAPLGGQEIELQQVDFDGEGRPPLGRPEAGDPLPEGSAQRRGVPISLLRTRIREGSRFTVFDIDPATAEQWAQAMLDWARLQPRA